MSSIKETNNEKFIRYSTKTEINIDRDNNLSVYFVDGAFTTLKFIGEFIAQINNLTSQEHTHLNPAFKEFPEQFRVKVYRHAKGGEVITNNTYEVGNRNVYSYFESMAEMGMLFSGTLRYVIFEKTLANTLYETPPEQHT